MNVTAYQEKEKNEKMKAEISKRKAGEERRQATDFKKAMSYFSAVIQGGSTAKNEGECLG